MSSRDTDIEIFDTENLSLAPRINRLAVNYPITTHDFFPSTTVVAENPMSVLAKTNPDVVHDIVKKYLELEERKNIRKHVSESEQRRLDAIKSVSAQHTDNISNWIKNRNPGETRARVHSDSGPIAKSRIRRFFEGDETEFSLTTTMEID